MTTAGRSRILLAAAALLGVLVAVGALSLFDRAGRSERSGSPPSTSGSAPRSRGGPTADDGSTTGSDRPTTTSPAVTVAVPRADTEQAPDLQLPPPPDPAPPDTAPTEVGPITDPQQAATAYLIAAETVTADDANRRHRRAEPYLTAGNPEAQTGVLVADAPPPGHARTAEVVSMVEWARNDEAGRIAYEVTYQRRLSPTIPASATVPDGAPQVTYVVVERQSGGNWLVALRAAALDPVE